MKMILAAAPFAILLSLTACDQLSTQAPEKGVQLSAPSAPVAAPSQAPATQASAALLSPEKLTERAPDVYKARFATTKGDFVIEVRREWAPNGADRFYNLVKNGFFDDTAFFRVVSGFMVQFGVTGNAEVNSRWIQAAIKDDPAQQSNKPGMVTFATAGPNTRTTQIFINYGDNANLDGQGFTPFGKVVSGMEVVNGLYSGYGDGPPFGRGPDQGRLQREGNTYLRRDFASMDYTKTAKLEP